MAAQRALPFIQPIIGKIALDDEGNPTIQSSEVLDMFYDFEDPMQAIYRLISTLAKQMPYEGPQREGLFVELLKEYAASLADE